MGGHTLHVWLGGSDDGLYHSICQADTDDEAAAKNIKALGTPVLSEDHCERHMYCKHWALPPLKERRLSLHILRACRQIHKEAALIAFTSNTLSVGRTPTECLQRMIPAQARAIRSIVFEDGEASLRHANILESKLKGLKHVVAYKKFLPIETATVAVYAGTKKAFDRDGVDKATIDKLAGEVERWLTAPSDGLTWKQRHATAK
ncbi:hypothetical protein B0A55_12299 [Friedmanniomyces simplex]|uniref:Uncharacterized protein n=1 Tax=Friedmanniomyces simplex TaxID=329884 RepID=A0A4U0W077_9PEZI|nr:hypothetical protein B0A55_12299 [Friedmanniomyces simplex]